MTAGAPDPSEPSVGWLRPKGLALFLAALVLVVGGWLLFAGTLVRWTVQAVGTALVGARVDLDDADVGVFPPAVVLTGLQVTDPDAPMTNAVEVARGEFALEGRPLLTGRVVVRSARLEGVRLGTPRKTSGAIERARGGKETGGPAVHLPELSLPDVAAILKDNPLTSVADAEALARDLKAARAGWEKRIQGLPGEDDLAAYRKVVRALKKTKPKTLGEIAAAAKEAERLRKDIEGDLKDLRSARSDLKRDLGDYRARAKAVAAAPAAEAKALADRYAGEGLAGVGAFFLKPQVEDLVRRGLGWYRRIEPVLARAAQETGKARVSRPARGRGEVVRFPERHPVPGFLIREAAVEVSADGGTVAGEVRDMTNRPEVLRTPLTYSFHGAGLRRVSDVVVEGAFDRTDPKRPHDRIHVALTGARVKDRILAKGGPVPVTLAESGADLTVDGAREGGAQGADGTIRGSVNLALTGARFDVGRAEGPVAVAVADALKGVSAATVRAAVSGPPDAPKVTVRSDLDRVIGNAVKAAAGAQVAALMSDLEQRIRERAAGPLKDAGETLAQLDGPIGDLLTRRAGDLEGLLKDAVGPEAPRLPF